MARQYVCDRCGCINTKETDIVTISIVRIDMDEYTEKYEPGRVMEICKSKCLRELHRFLDSSSVKQDLKLPKLEIRPCGNYATSGTLGGLCIHCGCSQIEHQNK